MCKLFFNLIPTFHSLYAHNTSANNLIGTSMYTLSMTLIHDLQFYTLIQRNFYYIPNRSFCPGLYTVSEINKQNKQGQVQLLRTSTARALRMHWKNAKKWIIVLINGIYNVVDKFQPDRSKKADIITALHVPFVYQPKLLQPFSIN